MLTVVIHIVFFKNILLDDVCDEIIRFIHAVQRSQDYTLVHEDIKRCRMNFESFVAYFERLTYSGSG